MNKIPDGIVVDGELYARHGTLHHDPCSKCDFWDGNHCKHTICLAFDKITGIQATDTYFLKVDSLTLKHKH